MKGAVRRTAEALRHPHHGTITSIEQREARNGRAATCCVEIRHGPKPKPSNGPEIGYYPETSRVHVEPSEAKQYSVGDRVRIRLQPLGESEETNEGD